MSPLGSISDALRNGAAGVSSDFKLEMIEMLLDTNRSSLSALQNMLDEMKLTLETMRALREADADDHKPPGSEIYGVTVNALSDLVKHVDDFKDNQSRRQKKNKGKAKTHTTPTATPTSQINATRTPTADELHSFAHGVGLRGPALDGFSRFMLNIDAKTRKVYIDHLSSNYDVLETDEIEEFEEPEVEKEFFHPPGSAGFYVENIKGVATGDGRMTKRELEDFMGVSGSDEGIVVVWRGIRMGIGRRGMWGWRRVGRGRRRDRGGASRGLMPPRRVGVSLRAGWGCICFCATSRRRRCSWERISVRFGWQDVQRALVFLEILGRKAAGPARDG